MILYFFITAKLENFESEEYAILKYFNTFANIEKIDRIAYKYRRANEKSDCTKLLYDESWKSVDASNVKRLSKLYYMDINMFEYPADPFL